MRRGATPVSRWRRVIGVVALWAVTACSGAASDGDDAAPSTVAPAPAPSVVELPWLRRDGVFLRDDQGRAFIVRGVDYAYDDDGYPPERFELLDEDLDAIRSWGMNTIRIRVRDRRAGMYPSVPAEAGYLEGLDDLVRRVNERGMYVIIATGGPYNLLTINQHPDDPLFDSAKLLPGNPAREQWLDHLDRIFDRYRDWPGVIGFDPINEEIALPPDRLDADYMQAAHADALARLRDDDERHVYFQQPSGWNYQGRSVGVGHDLGDDNRFFCVKWAITPRAAERFVEQQRWAEAAGTPLFVCEWSLIDVTDVPEEAKLRLQREVEDLLAGGLTGAVRLGYLPNIRAGLVTEDREERFWIDEWVRPTPDWIGGDPESMAWDPASRTFTLTVLADGRSPTTIFVPARTYPDGFEVRMSTGHAVTVGGGETFDGGAVAFDPATRVLTVTPGAGRLTVVVETAS